MWHAGRDHANPCMYGIKQRTWSEMKFAMKLESEFMKMINNSLHVKASSVYLYCMTTQLMYIIEIHSL